MHARIADSRERTLSCTSRRRCFISRAAHQRSTRLSHAAYVGVQCGCTRGCRATHRRINAGLCVPSVSMMTCTSRSAAPGHRGRSRRRDTRSRDAADESDPARVPSSLPVRQRATSSRAGCRRGSAGQRGPGAGGAPAPCDPRPGSAACRRRRRPRACCGGLRYTPTRSRTVSMRTGSGDSVKVFVRCGCSSKAYQMRGTRIGHRWSRPPGSSCCGGR